MFFPQIKIQKIAHNLDRYGLRQIVYFWYMKKLILFPVFLAAGFLSSAQKNWPDPDEILVGDRKQPAILLVGSFHFAYYNFDAHKTDKSKQVDILSSRKQEEVKELISYLAKFKPTRIAVEADANTGFLLRRYERWKKGERSLDKDEIEQIGFRLMDQFNLDTIYGVNDGPMLFDLYNTKDSNTFRPVLDSIYADWDFSSNDPLSQIYSTYYKSNDALALEMSLLEYFKYTNTDKILDRGFGSYLTGDFTLGDTRGADALAMHWYSRNLRIYRHIQQIATSPEDLILVIYGRGHVEILKHLFHCSPEFRLIKFNDLQ
jgi:hypothetical protein